MFLIPYIFLIFSLFIGTCTCKILRNTLINIFVDCCRTFVCIYIYIYCIKFKENVIYKRVLFSFVTLDRCGNHL